MRRKRMRQPCSSLTVASSGAVRRDSAHRLRARHGGRALLLHPFSFSARPFALIPRNVAWEHLAYRGGTMPNFAYFGGQVRKIRLLSTNKSLPAPVSESAPHPFELSHFVTEERL